MTDYSAALYIRLSREDENEGPSESVQNQKSLLDEFARRQHLRVFDTYIDDGWSGTSFDRPAFRRMLDDIEARRVNMVVTKDLSRLGRDYIMTGHYMEHYFPEKRVRYISLLDGIDTGVDSTANDITPFRAIMNDMYAKDISKKIKSVKRDKQRKGQFIGGKPVYGYKMHPTEKNRIVVDAAAAPTVRHIFGMALDGMSCRQIAARLNEEGVLTPAVYAGLPIRRPGPYSGLWSAERVADMLQNETYIGNMVQGRRARVSYKSKKCVRQPREDWITVENTHEPIIAPDEFRRVQLMLRSRRQTRRRTYDFPLKGLIFCHECGRPLGVLNRKNAAGEDVLYFVCRTYQRCTGAGVCTSHTVREQAVTEAVRARLREVCAACPDPGEVLRMAEGAAAGALGPDGREREVRTLQSRMDSLTAGLDKLYMDRLDGLLAQEDFDRLYTRIRTERDALRQRLKQAGRPVRAPEGETEPMVRRSDGAAGADRELLVSLVERVELTADRQVIVRFRAPAQETEALTGRSLTSGAALCIADREKSPGAAPRGPAALTGVRPAG